MSRLRAHPKAVALAALVILVVVLYETDVIPHLPDAKKVIEDVAQALGSWTYVLVAVLAFLETGAFVGLVAPGETAVMVAGVIAGQGEIDLIPLIGLVWISAVLGDTCSFFIGRRLAREFVLKHGAKVKIDEERLSTVESYFERHGGKTILIGRFIGLVRALAPFVIGSSGFPYRRFIPFSVIGCGLWATLYCVLGYIFYRSFDQLTAVEGKATVAFAVVVAVVVGIVVAYRKLRHPEQRAAVLARMDERPVLRSFAKAARPIGRALGPRLRFLGRRLTPGDLGLELTTTLAVAGIGLYVFVLYTVLISGDTTFTPADLRLLDWMGDIRTAPLTDVLKVVTDLGSSPIAGALLLFTCIVLTARGHTTEMLTLLAGALIVYIGVQLAKAGVDRPRPTGGLTTTDGSSFPSGHAAYSTIWVAVAVVVSRVLPGPVSRVALVSAGFAITVIVGLSRIYLRAHYWSDVAAGWGLGAAALGGCAVVALVVDHIRHNGRPAAPDATAS